MPHIPLCIQPLPGIGDMLWFVPHLRAIAAQSPAKQIYILTKKSSLADQLLEEESWVAGYIWLKRDHRQSKDAKNWAHDGLLGRWRLSRELKRYNFKEAWSLHPSRYYAQVMALAGIKKRHGYSVEQGRWLLTDRTILASSYKNKPFREQVSAFLTHAGLDLTPFDSPVAINPLARKAIDEKFGNKKGKRIILGIGASGPEKIWPAESFAQLIQQVAQLRQDVEFCLCGAKAEEETAAKILQLCADKTSLLINGTDLPLQQSLALIESSDLYIGNDTSLMNMAVNQGKKAIGLFGPTYTVYSDLIIPLISPNKKIEAISVDEVICKIKEQHF